MQLSVRIIREYANYLCREEKSAATQEKYLRDVKVFSIYTASGEITKELVHSSTVIFDIKTVLKFQDKKV